MTYCHACGSALALLHDQLQDGEYAFFNLEDWVTRNADELVMVEDLPEVACPVPACRGVLQLYSSQFACATVHQVECQQPGVIVLKATVVFTLSINVDLDDEDYKDRPKGDPTTRWRKRSRRHIRYPEVKSVNIKTAVSVNLQMTIRGARCTGHKLAFIEGTYGRVAFRPEHDGFAPPSPTDDLVWDGREVVPLAKADSHPE